MQPDPKQEVLDKVMHDYPALRVTIDYYPNIRKNYDGICWPFRGIIHIYQCTDPASVLAHELGHCVHAQYHMEDFKKRTEYGQELFAEDFARKYAGEYYLNDINYSAYAGARYERVYHETFPYIDYHNAAGDKLYYENKDCQITLSHRGADIANLYVWQVTLASTGKTYYNNKPVSFITAERNAIRKLRKLGVQI